ncbi:MAG: hypothetical protein MR607_04190 [Lachnospiraceae bacterium]|jgi:hypothetical protein|nr:hypothetical protein [Lachnospiraceae bacterium]MDY6334284.1 hypothetical protein [Lachnospiraceae bacterium]
MVFELCKPRKREDPAGWEDLPEEAQALFAPEFRRGTAGLLLCLVVCGGQHT